MRPGGDTLLGQRTVIIDVVNGRGQHVTRIANADLGDLAGLGREREDV